MYTFKALVTVESSLKKLSILFPSLAYEELLFICQSWLFYFSTLIDEKFYLVVLICIFLITSEHVFMLLLNIKFFSSHITCLYSLCIFLLFFSLIYSYLCFCILILFNFLCYKFVLLVCHLLFNFEIILLISFISGIF